MTICKCKCNCVDNILPYNISIKFIFAVLEDNGELNKYLGNIMITPLFNGSFDFKILDIETTESILFNNITIRSLKTDKGFFGVNNLYKLSYDNCLGILNLYLKDGTLNIVGKKYVDNGNPIVFNIEPNNYIK
jgi:hypothetical protein